jgi:flagellar biosynthesis protein FliR
MPGNPSLPLAAVYAFLLVLARVSGFVVFVPIPGTSSGPEPARIVLGLSLTIALYPLWPAVTGNPGIGQFTAWMMAEAVLGLTVGLVVGFLSEAFVLCGQMVGLQAGYSFASTVDPTTQADSTMLSILAQLIAGLLFFSMGLHREVLRIFAHSLETVPPGSYSISPAAGEAILRMSGAMFSTGLRLALPVVALLVMVDISLALLGRINSQLQLISLAFPAKMLAALALLAIMMATFPHVYRDAAERIFEALPGLVDSGGRKSARSNVGRPPRSARVPLDPPLPHIIANRPPAVSRAELPRIAAQHDAAAAFPAPPRAANQVSFAPRYAFSAVRPEALPA